MKSPDENHIKQLLDRWLDGDTSLDEENVLATYFRTHDVRPEWLPYKKMFAYIEEGCPETPAPKVVSPKFGRKWFAAAACAIALLALGALLLHSPQKTIVAPEPHLAVADTAQALLPDTVTQRSPQKVQAVPDKPSSLPATQLERMKYNPKVHYAFDTFNDEATRVADSIFAAQSREAEMLMLELQREYALKLVADLAQPCDTLLLLATHLEDE